MSRKRISAGLDASEYEAFQEYCEEHGYTDAEGVRRLISDGLDGAEREPPPDDRLTDELAALRRNQTRHRRRDFAWMGLLVVAIVYLAVAQLGVLGTQLTTDIGLVIGVAAVAIVGLSLAGQL
jgi:hypothetical protein